MTRYHEEERINKKVKEMCALLSEFQYDKNMLWHLANEFSAMALTMIDCPSSQIKNFMKNLKTRMKLLKQRPAKDSFIVEHTNRMQ